MKSRVASARAIDGLDRVDCAVQLLEEEWRRHGDVPLERFWGKERGALAGDAQSEVAMLVALIKADLRRRFDCGEKPTVQSYLERFPELRATDDRVVSLVYEEFCLSEERGHAPQGRVVLQAVPRLAELAGFAASVSPPLERSRGLQTPCYPGVSQCRGQLSNIFDWLPNWELAGLRGCFSPATLRWAASSSCSKSRSAVRSPRSRARSIIRTSSR